MPEHDESGTKFSDTSGINWATQIPKPIPVQKVEKPRLWPCATCSKPTRSHKFPDGTYLCHRCLENMSKEEQDGFAREHTIDRYPARSGGVTAVDSDSASETEKQTLP